MNSRDVMTVEAKKMNDAPSSSSSFGSLLLPDFNMIS